MKPFRPARGRDADATRTALLTAARAEFHKTGYEGASLRRIAADAGCNVSLVNRYFGSKQGLFEAVLGGCFDLSPLAGLSPEEMVSALVDIALKKAGQQSGFDPMVVAIRSSGSPASRDIIRRQLGDPMVEGLAEIIGGEGARQKAGLILSLISGVFVGGVSIGAQALSREHHDTMRPVLADALHAILSSETERQTGQ